MSEQVDEGDEVLLRAKVARANAEQALIGFTSMEGPYSIRVPLSEITRERTVGRRPPEFRTNRDWALHIANQNIERIKSEVGPAGGYATFEEGVAETLAAHLVVGWAMRERFEQAQKQAWYEGFLCADNGGDESENPHG